MFTLDQLVMLRTFANMFKDRRIDKSIEEMSELLFELTRAKKNQMHIRNMMDESADVVLTTVMLGLAYDEEEFNRCLKEKMMKLQSLMNPKGDIVDDLLAKMKGK